MSCSKPLPPFVSDSLYYLNRDQLDRFTIVCLPLKNFIERYLHSKPYRVFDRLAIRGGSYALINNDVKWQPNRDGYSVQQFLAGQICSVQNGSKYYSFAEMRPYLSPTVRINKTIIYIAADSTYNPEHIAEMESIAYLWRDSELSIDRVRSNLSRIGAEHFQPILNSPTILQCRKLYMSYVNFSLKDYKVLYKAKVIEMLHGDDENIELWLQYLQQFIEQPGIKPIIVWRVFLRDDFDIFLDLLSKDFSSAVVPNAFKVVFVFMGQPPLTKFCETNKTSGEKMELKEGIPVECQNKLSECFINYTLERSTI